MTKNVIEHENCFALNFGVQLQLPIPQIQANIRDFAISREIAPGKCFLVFVGGKYVDHIDDVLRVVNNVSDDVVYKNPLHTFLLTESLNGFKLQYQDENLRTPKMVSKHIP